MKYILCVSYLLYIIKIVRNYISFHFMLNYRLEYLDILMTLKKCYLVALTKIYLDHLRTIFISLVQQRGRQPTRLQSGYLWTFVIRKGLPISFQNIFIERLLCFHSLEFESSVDKTYKTKYYLAKILAHVCIRTHVKKFLSKVSCKHLHMFYNPLSWTGMLNWSIRSSTRACSVSTISGDMKRCVSSRSCSINFLPRASVSSRCRRNCFIAGSLECRKNVG